MKLKTINSKSAPKPVGPYTQALELSDFNRLLFISGQVPESMNGSDPVDFEQQAKLTWENLIAQLNEAGMTVNNLVKVTTFLSSREHQQLNREVRQHHLGDHLPALTVIVTGIFEEHWFIEIEAIAAA